MKKFITVILLLVGLTASAQLNFNLGGGYDIKQNRSIYTGGLSYLILKHVEPEIGIRVVPKREAFQDNYIGGRIGIKPLSSLTLSYGRYYNYRCGDSKAYNYWVNLYALSLSQPIIDEADLSLESAVVNKNLQLTIGLKIHP